MYTNLTKLFAIILSLCLLLCGCSVKDISEPDSESDSGVVSELASDTESSDGIVGEAVHIRNTDPQTFSKDFDGIVLTVTTDKTEYLLDEPIYVTASVKNNSDETVGLYSPTGMLNSHKVIATRINQNGEYLYDPVYGNIITFDMKSLIIEPGEEYVQEMEFQTYYTDFIDRGDLAQPGVYSGGAAITVLADPTDVESKRTGHSVDFSLTLLDDAPDTVSKNNAPQTFSKDFDGVVLTVTTDKTEYNLGDTIYVTASVKNNTDETVGLYSPTGTKAAHKEIITHITRGDKELIDIDASLFGTDMVHIEVIEPGGEYVQPMKFFAYYDNDPWSSDGDEPALSGVYNGTCSIRILPGGVDTETFTPYVSMDFTLKIV